MVGRPGVAHGLVASVSAPVPHPGPGIWDRQSSPQAVCGKWALQETPHRAAGGAAFPASWRMLHGLRPPCWAGVPLAGREEGELTMKDKGTCQQVLHPSGWGIWRASRSFLAFGSVVGEASWLRRIL